MSSRGIPVSYGWLVVAMGTFVVFAALGLARFGYSALLQPMQVALGMDNTQAGVVASANLAGYLVLSIVGGALATHFGPRRIIGLGLLLAGAAMIMTGMARSFEGAAFWRAVTGIGSGASNVPVMGLLAAWAVTRRRGLVTGIAASGSSVALILVGLYVPSVLSSRPDDGWRVAWIFFGVIAILIAGGAFMILRNKPSDLGCEPLGQEEGTVSAPVEIEKANWGSVFKSSQVWRLGLVYVAFGFSYIIYMTFFVKRLVAEGGYSVGEAGKLFMLMGWFSMFCGVIWGTVSDIIGRKAALVVVYAVQAVAFWLFATSASTGFVVSAILFGLTAWSIPAIMAAACGDMLGPRMAPAALGFITLFFGVGQALGPAVAGMMADSSHSFAGAFQLAAAVALLGAVCAALLPSKEGAACRSAS